MTYAPGTNRLFVAERRGKIWSFVNKTDVDKADLALELESARTPRASDAADDLRASRSIPKFKDNGYVYVTWIPDGSKEGIAERHARVALHGQGRAAGRRPGHRRRSSSNGPTAATTAAA